MWAELRSLHWGTIGARVGETACHLVKGVRRRMHRKTSSCTVNHAQDLIHHHPYSVTPPPLYESDMCECGESGCIDDTNYVPEGLERNKRYLISKRKKKKKNVLLPRLLLLPDSQRWIIIPRTTTDWQNGKRKKGVFSLELWNRASPIFIVIVSLSQLQLNLKKKKRKANNKNYNDNSENSEEIQPCGIFSADEQLFM